MTNENETSGHVKTQPKGHSQRQWKMESRIGELFLVASEYGLRGVYWTKQPVESVTSLIEPGRATELLARAVEELTEYLDGTRKTFTMPLDIDGTEFQKKVWSELRKIPYGETASYADIARRVEKEKAVRAVGTANGRNRLSIIIPCHRVVASDGTLGGYSGGLGIKSKLLAIEGNRSPSEKNG